MSEDYTPPERAKNDCYPDHMEDDGTGWARPNASWKAGYDYGVVKVLRESAAMFLKRAGEIEAKE